MTLTLSMAPGVAALRVEAVVRIVNTIEPHGDFCHANDPDQEHDSGLGDGSRQRACQRKCPLIPFQFAEPGTDVTNNRRLFGSPQNYIDAALLSERGTAKRVSIRSALTSVRFAPPRWRKPEAIAVRHLVGNRSRLDVAEGGYGFAIRKFY